MSETIPKCTSWLGHKFEARYSVAPVPEPVAARCIGAAEYATSAVKMMEATKGHDYERDVCIRCGATVEKSTITT